MPRILAVDWDQYEARYVLANVRGSHVRVQAAATVPLVDVVVAGGQPHPELGSALRGALAGENTRRTTTLVAVNRGSVELLHFTVPPASDAELPEMVANQAMQESQSIGDDWALDFLPSGDPSQPREITAAALSPANLEQIRETCSVAGLKPLRLLLRPYASTSLFLRTVVEPEDVCLLVNRMADELDLTLVMDDQVAFSRTVRLPCFADEQKAAARILAEIRRTVTVGLQSQPGSSQLDRVYVFGSAKEHEVLLGVLEEELSLPVGALDPFETVDDRGMDVPPEPGRFASLLGMILDEAHEARHAIDFLHPRQQPKSLDRRKLGALIAAAVVIIGTLVGYSVHSRLEAEEVKIRNLKSRLGRLNKKIRSANDDMRVAVAVNQWLAGNVLWLEELRELSIRAPEDQDAVLLRMSMAPVRSGEGGGTITFQGLAADPLTVTRMEYMLRDGFHRVSSRSIRQRDRQKDYPWHFSTSVFAARRRASQYTSHLPEGPETDLADAGETQPNETLPEETQEKRSP